MKSNSKVIIAILVLAFIVIMALFIPLSAVLVLAFLLILLLSYLNKRYSNKAKSQNVEKVRSA